MTTSATALIQLGIAAEAAKKLGLTIATLAGVGTAQTGAKNITVNAALLTTSGGATAFVFPTTWEIGDEVTVWNTSSTTALIYPQSGGAINGGSANASVSVAQNQGTVFTKVSATSWRAVLTSSSSPSYSSLAVSGTIAGGGAITSSSPTAGIGYATGAGGAVTQDTSRTTGVTLNTDTGAITLFSAAGSATPATFTVTNSAVAATDVVIVNQKSGTDPYFISVTNVGAGSFKITSYTGGSTTETPVFNFAVIKGVAA